MRAIIGQQVSIKAAAAIWDRLDAATGGAADPANVAATDGDALRAAGLPVEGVRKVAEGSPHVVELIEAGSGPLNDLIAALHTKLLVAELERHGAGRKGDADRIR